jgi:hypothetical protein
VIDGNWDADVDVEKDAANLDEYMLLWVAVTEVYLNIWMCRIRSGGRGKRMVIFSVRSPYAAKFVGREVTPYSEFMWKYIEPLQCHFFVWLDMRNYCWTYWRRGDYHTRRSALIVINMKNRSIIYSSPMSSL